MKKPFAYISAAWQAIDTDQAAVYCRKVYLAGFTPICPILYLPHFLNDIAVAQRLGITATTLDGILKIRSQGHEEAR